MGMRVLILCDQFVPGFAPRMGYLCKYLSQEGVECHVASVRHDDNRYQMLCGYAKEVEYVDFYNRKSKFKYKISWVFVTLLNVMVQYKDRRLVRAVRRNPRMCGYDAVLCSTYRTFPLKAAYTLSKHFHVPFIADLRDIAEQFPDHSYLAYRMPGGRVGEWIENLMIKRMIRQRNRMIRKADAVVSVSPWHVKVLGSLNPNIHLIYNGYDSDFFFPNHLPDKVFRITFTGRILSLRLRNPALLFEAVANLSRKGLIGAEDFWLEWFTDEAGKKLLAAEAAKYGIEAFMHYPGFIPAHEVPKALNRSSVLLQLANRADADGPKGIMTTKIFEALAVEKPLLLIPGDGSYLEDLVKRYNCGLAAKEVVEVEDFIRAQYALWRKEGKTSVRYTPEQQREMEALYSRKGQAAEFKRIMIGCAAGGNRNAPKAGR